MKKLAFGILCMAAAILLMSHNTFAFEVGRDVQYYASKHFTLQAYGASSNSWAYLDNNKCIRANGTVAFNNISLAGIPYTETKAGDFIQFWLTIGINAENNSTDTMLRGVYLNDTHFKTVATEYSNLNGSNGMLTITARVENDYSFSGEILLGLAGGSPTWVLYNNEYVYAGEITFWRPMTQASNQDIINAINNQTDYTQKLNEISNKMSQQQQAEEDAVDNIEEQTPSDISSSGNTENQASTNLIGAFSNFVSALTNIQTGNCNITLGFPDYAGGSRTVNICQNKDKAGNLISVFSSLTLIVFYIPLAIRLLTMIYNEIRSYTNG